jgi:hypothetical protein
LIVAALLIATLCEAQETTLSFSGYTVIVQGSIPDIAKLPARGFTLYSGDDLEIMIWACQDSSKPKDYWYYVFAYNPQSPRETREVILIFCDKELGGLSFWADQDYFDGKPASHFLTPQKKKPDLQKLILMKRQGFKFDV